MAPLLLLLSLSHAVHAGPWIKDPGHWYSKISAGNFVATEYVDPKVQTSSTLDYTGVTASWYTEVGLTQGLQLVTQLPYTRGRNYDTQTGQQYTSSALGDAMLGLGLDIPRVDLPASVHVTARIPMYDDGDRPDLYPALGDEQIDIDVMASVGHGVPLGDQSGWAVAELGYRHRTQISPAGNTPAIDYVDGMPYHAQIGISPHIGDHTLGFATLDLSGLVRLSASDDTKQWHQWGAGLAVAAAAGVHVELGFQQIYAASASSKGWGGSIGVSHSR